MYYIIANCIIFKIQNPYIFEEVIATLVRPEKVAKSTPNSLKGCTYWLIAGRELALKKIWDWFSDF